MPDATASKHPYPGEVSALQRYYDHRPFYQRVSQRLGLQVKLIVSTVALVAIALGSFCYVSVRNAREQTIAAWGATVREISASLAATTPDLIAADRLEPVYAASRKLVNSGRGILNICFYRADGTPFVSESRTGRFNVEPLDVRRIDLSEAPVQSDDKRWGPILCSTALLYDSNHSIIGYVSVGVSFDRLQTGTADLQATAVKIGAILFLASIPIAWLLVRRIFLPVRQFVATLKRVGADDLDTAVETKRPDVVGELARAFNDMRHTVRQQQAALKQVNQTLAETNHDLENRIEQRTSQFETANRRLTMEIAEKEDFLRAVSHDLNAPLRNISGMVTMLLIKKKGQLDEDLLHRLDRIKKNVEIETDLINELLELSRIKTRRQAMENVELESLLWELRGMFENDLKTRDIGLVIDSQMPTLFGERARLRQVFQNLIDNAIKYMGDGPTREIHIGCQLRLSEAEFYVRDTGVGIDSEDVGKVFFIFRRGKNTNVPNVPGKGVGLASVKSIVETYNGKIWVESELGVGTTFRFTVNGQFVPATGLGVASAPKTILQESPRIAA